LLKVSCVAAAAAADSSVILQSVSVGRPQFVQPPNQLCVQVLISRGPCPVSRDVKPDVITLVTTR